MTQGLPVHVKKIPESLLKTYADHSGSVDSTAELAAVAGMTEGEVEEWLQDRDVSAVLEAAAVRADAEGRTLVIFARKARLNFLRTIYRESKDVDITDIPDLDKVLTRVLDQADRVRIAERETENLPLVHITFGAGFELKTEVVTPRKFGDVIDAMPMRAALATSTGTGTADADLLGVLKLPVTPLENEGGDEWRP